MPAANRNQGEHAEMLASRFLQQQGLTLLEKNFMCKCGEIDLIMQDKEQLVFVEVRYRKNTHFGTPAESVTWQKQQKILKTAALYLQKHKKYRHVPARFDIVAITGMLAKPQIDWITNAFQA